MDVAAVAAENDTGVSSNVISSKGANISSQQSAYNMFGQGPMDISPARMKQAESDASRLESSMTSVSINSQFQQDSASSDNITGRFDKEVGSRRSSIAIASPPTTKPATASSTLDSSVDSPPTSAGTTLVGISSGTTSLASALTGIDSRLLRLEVESTLHKTLEVEYMLTLKEIKSYEAQLATAELECNRALQALHEAEMVKRERRRELDLALQDRSEAQSIVRHLTHRSESLSNRIREGSQRLNALRNSINVGGVSGGPASNGASLAVPGTASSILSGRRHSTPCLTSAVGSSAATFAIPASLTLADVSEEKDSSSNKDADEVGSITSLKRARTTSPANNNEETSAPNSVVLHASTASAAASAAAATVTNAPPALSINTSMLAPSSQSSGPYSATTPLTAATQLVDLRSAAGSPPPNMMPTSSSHSCINFQKGQCGASSSRDCRHQHVCIRCGGSHPVILCKKDRNVCVKWNMEECSSTCHREHRCLRCASREHTLRVCPIRPLGGAEFCFGMCLLFCRFERAGSSLLTACLQLFSLELCWNLQDR
jgi:hypothetical protein